jgi:hypothetical protein
LPDEHIFEKNQKNTTHPNFFFFSVYEKKSQQHNPCSNPKRHKDRVGKFIFFKKTQTVRLPYKARNVMKKLMMILLVGMATIFSAEKASAYKIEINIPLPSIDFGVPSGHGECNDRGICRITGWFSPTHPNPTNPNEPQVGFINDGKLTYAFFPVASLENAGQYFQRNTFVMDNNYEISNTLADYFKIPEGVIIREGEYTTRLTDDGKYLYFVIN